MATNERHGPPCPHGSLTVCPHCDPRGFLFAYAATANIIENLGHSDADMWAMVHRTSPKLIAQPTGFNVPANA